MTTEIKTKAKQKKSLLDISSNESFQLGLKEDKNNADPKLDPEIEKKIKELVDAKLTNVQSSLLTAFGILASLIAFISIEIQILKSVCDFDRSIGLSLIMLGGLLGFALTIKFLLDDKFTKSLPGYIVTFLAVGLIGIGLWRISVTNETEYFCNSESLKRELNQILYQANMVLSGYQSEYQNQISNFIDERNQFTGSNIQ